MFSTKSKKGLVVYSGCFTISLEQKRHIKQYYVSSRTIKKLRLSHNEKKNTKNIKTTTYQNTARICLGVSSPNLVNTFKLVSFPMPLQIKLIPNPGSQFLKQGVQKLEILSLTPKSCTMSLDTWSYNTPYKMWCVCLTFFFHWRT